jgi:hypothetical protein
MKQICTIRNAAIFLVASKKRIRNCFLILLFALPYFLSAQTNSNASQFIPELVFQNPALVSGNDKLEGAIYRFSNVASGIDALLEVKKISDNTTVINDLDKSDVGWKKAFQPQLGKNGTVGANQNWWILFHMTFVAAGTTKKIVLSKFYVTALDVDGDNVSIQEYVQMQGADSTKFSTISFLSLASPINCGLPNTLKDKLTQGPVQNFSDIDTSSTSVMATYTYLNTSDLDFTIGAKSGASSSSAGLRLNSLWFKSFSLAPQSTLPLQLINFQGNINNNKASLEWSVAENETGNSFELERSFDGTHFNSTALIFTTSKTGSEKYSYKESIDRTSFYRLKMINKDNSISYSKIIRLSVEEATGNQIKILQNPAGSSLQFSYSTTSNESTKVNIYTITGAKVFSTELQSQTGTNTFMLTLNSKMNKGFYILETLNTTGSSSISKFIKQ